MAPAPDTEVTRLYTEAARGDGAAAEALLLSYLPRLRAFVRSRLSPELRARESDSDVVQSVCRELLEHKDGFRYQGEAEFRGWLFTAAANKVREKYRFHHQGRRDRAREHVAPSEAPPCAAGSSASPSYAAITNERVAILEAALDDLSDSDREVVTLARLAGLPMAEVATRLGKTEVAARKQLGRALLRLGAALAERQTDLGSR
jgi:RNA polymerase sigma-70 factor (subfamily 1)